MFKASFKPVQFLVASALLLPLSALAGVTVDDGIDAPNSDDSSVNKSVSIGSDARVGDVSTVNGGIRIGEGATTGTVESVNGGIKIYDQAQVEAVESVNGGISLGEGVIVSRSIESVNGTIRVPDGGQISGNVSSVNGTIDLEGTLVQGDIVTYNGAIELQGAEVMGDLYVKKPKGWGWGNKKATRVTIGPGTIVHGDLHFDKAVKLTLDKSAQVGEIHGDKVEINESRRMK